MSKQEGWILISRTYADRRKWAELKKLATALNTTRDQLLDKMLTSALAAYEIKVTAVKKEKI